MENQLQVMGKRLREIRTVLEISTAEMARINNITEAEYLRHETGETDSSFTFLYRCAERFGIDLSALVTGEMPRLSFYNLTRANSGVPISRRAGFEYLHKAANFKHRRTEPFVVKAPPQDENTPIPLSTHSGQEFDFVLKGTLKVQLEENIEILREGDSVYYDSAHRHGMIAIGDEPCEFLAVVIKGDAEPEPIAAPVDLTEEETAGRKDLIYHRFMEEFLDEHGHLHDVRFHIPETFNFAFDVVDEIAKKSPLKTAMVWLGREGDRKTFTFADISEKSARAANYLSSLGVKRGDRVMLVLKRHYQFWYIIIALHRMGAVPIPASNLLKQHDYEYRFNSAGIKAIIASADDGIPAEAESAFPASPTVNVKVIVNGTRPGWEPFDEKLDLFSGTFKRPEGQKLSDDFLMYFSSGTSGYPKIVPHGPAYAIGHIITARWWHNVDPNGLHFTISDTGWGKAVWGKLYGQWLCESAVFVYDFDKFHAEEILPLFQEFQITSFCAPPTMYRFFMKEGLEKYDLSSLKYANTAGEALQPEVFQQFKQATGLTIMEGFGQTETCMLIGNLIGMNPKPGSMGKPSPQYHVLLMDKEGNPSKPGEPGEIVVRADKGVNVGLFFGYLDPEKDAEAWHDGYYHTGDVAWRDEDGYLWYVGRMDDLIKSSGYRIGPFEIESVLVELPYIMECAVTGVPDPIRGQVVKATIVLASDKHPSDELKKEIQNYVKTHTAPYKYPRVIEFVKELPKTVNGKIRRVALRQPSN